MDKNAKRILSTLPFIGLIILLTGCASVAYQPGTSTGGTSMTASQAREHLKETLDEADFDKKITITEDGFQIYYPFHLTSTPATWCNKTFTYYFRDFDKINVIDHTPLVNVFQINQYTVQGVNIMWSQIGQAQLFADSLNVLKNERIKPSQNSAVNNSKNTPTSSNETSDSPSTLVP